MNEDNQLAEFKALVGQLTNEEIQGLTQLAKELLAKQNGQ